MLLVHMEVRDRMGTQEFNQTILATLGDILPKLVTWCEGMTVAAQERGGLAVLACLLNITSSFCSLSSFARVFFLM